MLTSRFNLPSKLSIVAITGVALLSAAASLDAQTTDYLYGLHNTSGATDAGVYNLIEIAIRDPRGTPTVTPTITSLTNLGQYMSGYNSSDRYFENINGLAIDSSSNTVYFNYTYGSSSDQLSGTYTLNLYQAIYDTASSSWGVSLAYTDTGGISSSSGAYFTANVQSGAFPRAAFNNGNYYTSGQETDNLIVINPNTLADNTNPPLHDDYDHTALDSTAGGDFVISSSGTLYTSSVTNSLTSDNTLRRQTLSNAINPAGGPATSVLFDSVIPNTTFGPVQIAGLGGSANLYGLTSNQGRLLLFGNPDASTAAGLNITNIGNLSGFIGGGTIADLSEGLTHPVTVPEPSGVLLLSITGLISILYRRRSC